MAARATVLALAVCVSLATAAAAAAAKPVKADKHDRALIAQLLRFDPGSLEEGEDAEFDAIVQACPAWAEVEEGGLDVALSMLVPVFLRVFDGLEPVLVSYGRSIAKIRPHAPVFKEWIAMRRRQTAQALAFVQRFDSARMDVCGYLDAVLAAGGDEAALEAAVNTLFAHPDDLAAVLEYGELQEATAESRKRVEARFATFLKASGYTKAQIATLTE